MQEPRYPSRLFFVGGSYVKEVVIVAENKLADMSVEFAVRILKLTDSIQGHHSLANQLEGSGTSIEANIRESKNVLILSLYPNIAVLSDYGRESDVP
jgi:hypothetical protein